ncbi:MAG: DNA polymerase III subunit [Candidatus Eremiobacteraeota bacterium]|nr:DNA polymerase III subunit [Candidatus Eremiobacteraeota bacterium]
MSELHFDVAGAAGSKQYFSRITRATISHAYLFSGPPGVGKKTFARRLAQSLLCESPKENVLGYDGTCPSCKLFASLNAGRHPDFLEHTGILKIGESDSATGFYESEGLTARDLVRQLSMQSYSGGLRVLLLGDIDFATHHAANALLKFFEEPPPGVVLILTSSAPGRLLPTIRSRVIELRFAPLSHAQVRDILLASGRDEAQAQLGASLGGGSVSRALASLEGEEESLRAAVAQWFFSVLRGDVAPENWASRDTLDEGLEVIKSLVRDWTAVAAAGAGAPMMSVDYADAIRDLPTLDAVRAIALVTKLNEAQRMARTNVSPAMVSEIVRMSLCS